MRGNDAFRHQHEDHEHGADGVQHEFDREHLHPDATGKGGILRTQKIPEQDRQHQNQTMQHRHHERRPTPLQFAAAFGPQFGCRQRGVNSDDAGPDRHPQRRSLRSEGLMTAAIQAMAPDREPRQIGLAAVKHPRGIPDHAAGDEAQRIERQRETFAEETACQRPQRHRCGAEQIGRSPPFQRWDPFLATEKQQHRTKHRGHHGGDEIKRRVEVSSNIKVPPPPEFDPHAKRGSTHRHTHKRKPAGVGNPFASTPKFSGKIASIAR